MEKFDVLFIGSGQAAWNAALPLAMQGKKVGIIEEGTVAGVCTNFGCDAKGLLDGPVKLLAEIEQFDEIGLETTDARINWEHLMAHKHAVIDPLSGQMQAMLEHSGIEFIFGHGEFRDSKTIVVEKKEYTATKIVIASGQRPARLNVPGKELMHDSTDFLDLPQMPESIAFIGAGYVSMELASIANAAGADVSIIEFAPRALNGFDAEYANKLVEKMQSSGVTFYFGEGLSKVEKTGTQYTVTTDKGTEFTTDYVLDATGRIPNVENLGLDKAGIDYDRGGISVNDHLQTSVENIYASGDIISKKQPKLTPVAAFEARYLTQLFLGVTDEAINYPVVATAAFTLPRIAQVGVTTDYAMEHPAEYQIKTIDLANSWDYKAMNEKDASMKLIFDKTGKLAGAVNYSNEAPEVINGLTTIIEQGLTIQELQRTLFAFPTLDYNLSFYLAQGLRS